MEKFKTVYDILLWAVEEEDKAYNLYLNLSKKSVDIRTRTFLEQISRDELKHKVVFSSFVKKNEEEFRTQKIDSIEIPLFHKVPDVEMTNIISILKFAISNEIVSNNLYIQLAYSITSNPLVQKVLFKFADEENKHKAGLELELEYYNGKVD